MMFYKDITSYIEGMSAELDELRNANIPDYGIILDILGPNENQDRLQNPGRHSVNRPVEQLTIDCNGIRGDRHRRLTRPSNAREAKLYGRTGVPIVNRRQVFVTSPSECEALTNTLGVEITAGLLGANLVIGREDRDEFYISDLPSNTYLVIGAPESTEPVKPPIATLIQYVRQKGCRLTGSAIVTRYCDQKLKKQFIENTRRRRGILCSVEYPVDEPATLERGQKVFFRFPEGSCY
jgi:hypothetical protein